MNSRTLVSKFTFIVDYSNLAQNKPAWQSSSASGGTADRAVDGKTDPDYSQGNTCTTTDNDYPPWWMVDLGEQYDVTQVVITNKNKNGNYCHAPFSQETYSSKFVG